MFRMFTQLFAVFTTLFSGTNRLAAAFENWTEVVEENSKVMADEARYERQRKADLIKAKQLAYKPEAVQAQIAHQP